MVGGDTRHDDVRLMMMIMMMIHLDQTLAAYIKLPAKQTTTGITRRNHGGPLLPAWLRIMFMSKTRGNSVARGLEGRVCKLSLGVYESTEVLYEAVALPSSWAGGGSEQQLVLQTARISWKRAGRRGEGRRW